MYSASCQGQKVDSSCCVFYTLMEFGFVEESEEVVIATKHNSCKPSEWKIAKRGTVFGTLPDHSKVNWFKDLTHLYREKTSGKGKGKREWATTLWLQHKNTQMLLSSQQVRDEIVF